MSMTKVAVETASRHPVLPDTGRARMAKADVRVPDTTWNEQIGAAIQKAIRDVWDSNKEAAAEIGVDDAEFGKWLNGTRRAQLDRLWAVSRLRRPLCLRFCELAGAQLHTRAEWPAERVG